MFLFLALKKVLPRTSRKSTENLVDSRQKGSLYRKSNGSMVTKGLRHFELTRMIR